MSVYRVEGDEAFEVVETSLGMVNSAPGRTVLEKILNAEDVLREMPQVEIPIVHTFADGLYSREIVIPKGVMCTGRIHKQADLNIVISGEMDVMTEHGMRRVKGPCTFKGRANTKQIGFAHEETRWITVHATDETDLRVIEATLFEDEGKPLLHDFATGKTVDIEWVRACREDYQKAIKELGYTEEMVQSEVHIDDAMVELDLPASGLCLAGSSIDGQGVFATRQFYPGDVVGVCNAGGRRTQLGRYTNHSHTPNTMVMRGVDGDFYLVAISPIANEELTVDYRQAFAASRLNKEALCRP